MEKEKRKNEEYRSPNPIALVLSGAANLLKAVLGGSWWIIRKSAKAGWWAIRGLSRGIWRIVRGASQGVVWMIKQPYRLLRYIINGRIPEFENTRQEEIFWRIKRKYRRKRLFLLNSLAYISSIFLSIYVIIDEYFRLERLSTPVFQRQDFREMLISMGLALFIWAFILIGHFVFNRMGNEEDQALGEALEHEYTRSKGKKADYSERHDRLIEPAFEDETDYEDKPQYNHDLRS